MSSRRRGSGVAASDDVMRARNTFHRSENSTSGRSFALTGGASASEAIADASADRLGQGAHLRWGARGTAQREDCPTPVAVTTWLNVRERFEQPVDGSALPPCLIRRFTDFNREVLLYVSHSHCFHL